jgi:hypothetical protein
MIMGEIGTVMAKIICCTPAAYWGEIGMVMGKINERY